MKAIPFKLSLFAALAAFPLACADDGSEDNTNASASGEASDSAAGTSEATDGSETSATGTSEATDGGETGMETGSVSASSTGTTDPGDETGQSSDDGSSSGGSPVVECPSRAQTCESLSPLRHCDLVAATGVCFEYLHECILLDGLEAGCVESGGTLGEGSCPAPGSWGTCIEAAELQFASVVYPIEGVDAADIEQGCVDGGGAWCPG